MSGTSLGSAARNITLTLSVKSNEEYSLHQQSTRLQHWNKNLIYYGIFKDSAMIWKTTLPNTLSPLHECIDISLFKVKIHVLGAWHNYYYHNKEHSCSSLLILCHLSRLIQCNVKIITMLTVTTARLNICGIFQWKAMLLYNRIACCLRIIKPASNQLSPAKSGAE